MLQFIGKLSQKNSKKIIEKKKQKKRRKKLQEKTNNEWPCKETVINIDVKHNEISHAE